MKEKMKHVILNYHLCRNEMSERIYQSTIDNLTHDLLDIIKQRDLVLLQKLQIEYTNIVNQPNPDSFLKEKLILDNIMTIFSDNLNS